MTIITHQDIKNARLTERKVPYIVVTAEGNTMPEPRKTEFILFIARSGNVTSANMVISGNMFFVPSIRRSFCTTVTGSTCL